LSDINIHTLNKILEKHSILAEKIYRYFQNGIQPDAGLRHYINSTFSNPGRQDLELLLSDRENCERESLVELIFFPDIALQKKLENTIEKECYTKDDVIPIHRALMKKYPVTTFFFPDPESPIRFETPGSGIKQFIVRLNIHKRTDTRLNEIITRCLHKEDRNLCKVMIRNAAFECKGKTTSFLRDFVLKMHPHHRFLEAFKFILSVLETGQTDSDPKIRLAHLKKTYQDTIRRAEQFSQRVKGRNVETLILQGVRIPHFNPVDDMQKIILIDDIGLAMYGETM
jgi:hypothetical protein